MCIILAITKPQLITNEMLNNCADANPDSVGIAYIKDGQIITLKDMKVKNGINLFNTAKKEHDPATCILMHYRIATSGKLNTYNQHPFIISDKSLAFAHNGIVSGLGDKKISDTRELCLILDSICLDVHNLRHITLLNLLSGYNNKFAFLDLQGKITIVNAKAGIEDGGNWFSNRSYKKEIFVSTFRNVEIGFQQPKVWDYKTDGTKKDVAKYCTTCGTLLYTEKEKSTMTCGFCYYRLPQLPQAKKEKDGNKSDLDKYGYGRGYTYFEDETNDGNFID